MSIILSVSRFLKTFSRNSCHFFGSILMNVCRKFAKILRKAQHLSSFGDHLQNRIHSVGNTYNSSENMMKLLSGPRAYMSLCDEAAESPPDSAPDLLGDGATP